MWLARGAVSWKFQINLKQIRLLQQDVASFGLATITEKEIRLF